MKVKNSKLIIYFIFFVFLVYGCIESARTATISSVIEENGLTYALGGTVITAYFIGYTISNFIMGIVAAKIGSRKVLVIGFVFFLIGTILYIIGNIAILLVGAFFTGIAGGAIAVSGNHIVVQADPENKGRNLNWTSLFHSIGSMVMPFYCSFLYATSISWKIAYITILPFIAVAIIFSFIIAFNKKDKNIHTTETKDNAQVKNKLPVSKGLVLLLGVVFLYVFSEVGIITWLVEFLTTQKGVSLESASRYLSVYFMLVMAGRFVGGVIIDRIGYEKSIIIMAFLAIITIAIGIITHEFSGVLLALSGLFYATIYPTGIAIISTLAPNNTQQAIGIYCASGGIGGILSGYLMGTIGDIFGMSVAMWLIILFLVGVIICAFAISYIKRKAV